MKQMKPMLFLGLMAATSIAAPAKADPFLATCSGHGGEVTRQDRLVACDVYLRSHLIEVYGPIDMRGRVIAMLARSRLLAIGEQFDLAGIAVRAPVVS